MKQNQIDLYSLLESHEKEHICEIVGEAIARTYGTDQINNFVWDLLGEKVDDWLILFKN